MSESWKKLDIGTARNHGAGCAEDVIQVLCGDCPEGNLGFTGDRFCPVQTGYGFDGEHEAVQYSDDDGFEIRCTRFENMKAKDLEEGRLDMTVFGYTEAH